MKQILLIIFAFVVIISCNKETPTNFNFNAEEIVELNNKFTFEFLETFNNINQDENYMVSPLSLYLALAMTYNGAETITKQEFEELFQFFDGRENLNEGNKNLIENLVTNNNNEIFAIANSIWIKENFSVKQEFINTNETFYAAEVSNLDFSDPTAVDAMNNWVANNTNDKIKTILDEINPKAIMYLINALYFNQTWKYEFDEDLTAIANFYKSENQIIEAEMMKTEEEFKYFETEDFQSVELPYNNNKFSMIAFLPKEGKNIGDMNNLMTFENYNNWQTNYELKNVQVNLPKFKYEYENELIDELLEMGFQNPFSSMADFSSIADERLRISKVIQKTFIDVSEKGTEAAAVTLVGIVNTSVNPNTPTIFNVNKPFLYLIKENQTGTICFIGKVEKPEIEE